MNRRQRGQPPKPEEQRKRTSVSFRVTAAQLRSIDLAAEKSHLDRSAWVRQKVLQAAVSEERDE